VTCENPNIWLFFRSKLIRKLQVGLFSQQYSYTVFPLRIYTMQLYSFLNQRDIYYSFLKQCSYTLPLRIGKSATIQLYYLQTLFPNSAAILFRSELVNQQQYSYTTFRLFSPIGYACKKRINQLDKYIIHEQASNLTG
jgi:hypothetical protein